MRARNLAIVRDEDIGIRTADRERLAADADQFTLVLTVVADFQDSHRRPEDGAKRTSGVLALTRLGVGFLRRLRNWTRGWRRSLTLGRCRRLSQRGQHRNILLDRRFDRLLAHHEAPVAVAGVSEGETGIWNKAIFDDRNPRLSC